VTSTRERVFGSAAAAVAVASTIPWEGAWAVRATSFVCDVAVHLHVLLAITCLS
jgi:hypothetical protein